MKKRECSRVRERMRESERERERDQSFFYVKVQKIAFRHVYLIKGMNLIKFSR